MGLVESDGVTVTYTHGFEYPRQQADVSYGLLQADSVLVTRLLTFFQLAAVALLTWWLLRADRKFLALGLGLVIGGALGNVIDRIRFSAVADFFFRNVPPQRITFEI